MKVENHIRSNIQLKRVKTSVVIICEHKMDAIRRELGETDEVSKEIMKWQVLIEQKNLQTM